MKVAHLAVQCHAVGGSGHGGKGAGELKGGVIMEGVLADFSPRQRVSALPRYPSYVGHTLTGIRDTLSPKTIVWDRTRTVYHIFHLHF